MCTPALVILVAMLVMAYPQLFISAIWAETVDRSCTPSKVYSLGTASAVARSASSEHVNSSALSAVGQHAQPVDRLAEDRCAGYRRTHGESLRGRPLCSCGQSRRLRSHRSRVHGPGKIDTSLSGVDAATGRQRRGPSCCGYWVVQLLMFAGVRTISICTQLRSPAALATSAGKQHTPATGASASSH